MATLVEELNPGGNSQMNWTYSHINDVIPREVISVTEEANLTPYKELLRPLRAEKYRDPHTGIGVVELGEPGDSTETAVVQINPNACGQTDNMLVRAEFIRRVLRKRGITDEAGNHLKVITLSAPSWASSLDLGHNGRKKTTEGNFAYPAIEYLKAVKALDVGRIALIGFSLGASIAVPAAAHARYEGLDALAVGAGEPPNVINRPVRKFVGSFFKDMKEMQTYIDHGCVYPSSKAHKRENQLLIGSGMLRRALTEAAIIRGFATDSFGEHDLLALESRGIPTTIAYGTESTVTPRVSIEDKLASYWLANPRGQELVQAVAIDGLRHPWDNHLQLLSTFYAYAVERGLAA